ncbi:uncharacterized protein [Hetaerina americana]|uniref:uncharacterized protein n=1 Tax=Hetaerina americana TaxID=62018 RepID=UPI003A7F3261
MSEVTEEDFVNVLAEIGIPKSNVSWKWLIYHKETEEFVKWICENVKSSNYLSDEELNEYKLLEASGQILEGEELENALAEMIPEYFELSEIDDDYMSALEDEISYIENYSRLAADLVEKQENQVLVVQREVSELENTLANQQSKLVNAQTMCLGKSSSLESSLQHLRNSLINLKAYSINCDGNVGNSKFMMEIPLDYYIEESNAFSRELDVNVEQVLSSSDAKNFCDISSQKNFDVELEKVKKGLQDTLLVKTDETAIRKGVESACKHVKGLLQSRKLWEYSSNHHAVIENLAEQKQILQRLKLRAKQCGPVEGLDPQSLRKIREMTAKWVGRKCMSLENLQKELQFHQKWTVCNKLGKLVEVVKSQCATDLVWLFLLGEEVTEVMNLLELAKSGESLLMGEQYHTMHRIESMKYIKEKRNYEISKAETWCLIYFLLNYLKTSHGKLSNSHHLSVNTMYSPSEDVFYSLKLLVEYSEKYESSNVKLELLMKEMSDNMISALKTSCRELAKLKGLICSGSTENYPMICSVKQLIYCYHSDSYSKKLKKKLGKLMAKYQAEKQKSCVWENTARSLWKKFVINPEEIQDLIKNMNVPTVLLNDEILLG